MNATLRKPLFLLYLLSFLVGLNLFALALGGATLFWVRHLTDASAERALAHQTDASRMEQRLLAVESYIARGESPANLERLVARHNLGLHPAHESQLVYLETAPTEREAMTLEEAPYQVAYDLANLDTPPALP